MPEYRHSSLAVFMAWGAVALAMAILASRVHTGHSPDLFLPAESPAREALMAHAAQAHSVGFAALGYEADDVLSPESLAAIDGLRADLEALPGVVDVQSLPTHLRGMTDLPEAMRVAMATQPDVANNLITPDRTAGAMWVTLSDLSAMNDIERSVTAHPNANIVHIGGSAAFAQTFDSMLTRDLLRVGPVLLGVMLLAMLIVFRRWQAAVLTMAVVGLGLLGALMPLALTGNPLTLLSLVALPLVTVAALATSIHWLWAWRRFGGDATAATRAIAAPCMWATLTTAAAMASLALTDFPTLRMMGLCAAVGVLITLPAALTLFPRGMSPAQPTFPKSPGTGATPARSPSLPSRRFAWGIFAAIALVACAGWPRLSVESNIALALPNSLPIRQASNWFESHLGGLVPLEVFSEGPGAAASPQAQATVALLRLDSTSRVIQRAGDADIFHATVRWPEMPSSLLSARLDSLRSQLSSIWPSSFTVTLTGPVPLILEAMTDMMRSLALSLAGAFAVIFALMAVALRSLRLAAIGLIPNALPLIGVLGVMGWTRRPVDLATTSLGCAALGIAVDDTIHVLHRHRLGARAGETVAATHSRIVSEIGPALALTTVIAILGFSALGLATFQPLRWFGLWAAIALGLALAADLWLLPTLFPKTILREPRA